MSRSEPHTEWGELALRLIELLRMAATEVERDAAAAKVCIARSSSLIRIKVARHTAAPVDRLSGGLARWQIREVKEFLEANLDRPLRVEDMSKVARLGATHFARAFKRSFGEPPHAYLVRRRLERAQHLMLASDIALSAIAITCGFSDHAHLGKLFRRAFGTSPSLWRREWRDGTDPVVHVADGSSPASATLQTQVAARGRR